eukprot:Rhum_TRINITY_DN11031_c0_g1::Rhum_TRINITY_DN11031_c0_g1_i1::g.41955::m.41955
MSSVGGLARRLSASRGRLVPCERSDSAAAAQIRQRIPELWELGVDEKRRGIRRLVPLVEGLRSSGYAVGEATLATAISRCEKAKSREGLETALRLAALGHDGAVLVNVRQSLLSNAAVFGIREYENAWQQLCPGLSHPCDSAVRRAKKVGGRSSEAAATSATEWLGFVSTRLKAVHAEVVTAKRQNDGSPDVAAWGWQQAETAWARGIDASVAEALGVQPTVVLLHATMKLARCGAEADWVFAKGRAHDVRPDAMLYAAAVRVGGDAGSFQSALRFFKMAQGDTHTTDAPVVWNALLAAAGVCQATLPAGVVEDTFRHICAKGFASVLTVELLLKHHTSAAAVKRLLVETKADTLLDERATQNLTRALERERDQAERASAAAQSQRRTHHAKTHVPPSVAERGCNKRDGTQPRRAAGRSSPRVVEAGKLMSLLGI